MELPQATERTRLGLALQIALGSVLWSSRSWAHPDAGKAYARALGLTEELAETTEIVTVLKGLLVSALGTGQFELASALGERTLLAAERSDDRAGSCSLLWHSTRSDAARAATTLLHP